MGTEPVGRSSNSASIRTVVMAVAAVILALGLALILTISSKPSDSPAGPGFPNADLSNTRFAQGPIHADTVADLAVTWKLPGSGGESAAYSPNGAYESSPVVTGGVIYLQDSESNVQAIDLENGEVLWERRYASSASGPNGIFVADGRVYGATTTEAFALAQESGEEIWSTALVRNTAEKVSMAPGYHDGLVFVSTIATMEKGGGVGILWALDAKTGRKAWSFDTVPKSLWGQPRVNSGGGLAFTPAIDDKGSMYFGVGGPGPIPGTEKYPWGSSRPGPNLYTNSIVKLSTKTGKLQWYYQLTPHTVCNWGLLGPPILVKAGKRDLVIAAGKAGIVIALDQHTGKLVWKRAVGVHNGHDNDGLYAMRGEYAMLKTPLTAYPGSQGGVPAPLSTNGSSVFIPVVNFGTTLANQTKAFFGRPSTGELVALDVASGAVQWTHEFPIGVYGATTAVNDVVFAATIDKAMYAFESGSGKQLWRTQLPASMVGGITASSDILLVPAGYEGNPAIVAYRLRE